MSATGMRVCRTCGELRPPDDFDIRADIEQPRSTCKDCRRRYQRERYRCSHPAPSRTPRRVGAASEFTCTRCGQTKEAEAFPPRRSGGEELQHWCRDCFAEANAKRYLAKRETEIRRLRRNVDRTRMANRELLREYLEMHPCIDCGETDPVVLEFDRLRDKRVEVTRLADSGATWALVAAEIEKCEVRCGNCHRRRTARTRHQRAVVDISPTGLLEAVDRSPKAPLQLQLLFGTRRCCGCNEVRPLAEFPGRGSIAHRVQSRCRACMAIYKRGWYLAHRGSLIQRARQSRDRTATENRTRLRAYLAERQCVDCDEQDRAVLEFDHLRDKTTEVSSMVSTGWSWKRIIEEIAKCEVVCTNCHKRRTRRRLAEERVELAS